MEPVSVKFQKDVLHKIDKSITKHNFNSRTEFIRESVRDKLSELSKEDLLKEFLQCRGKAKRKTTYADNKKTKELISKELMKELDQKFK
jgi:Arc/MetJ-type ribon-helix-helix transcriptional regulator